MLNGYHVLDLTDNRGYFCGKVLAGLGADVVKVESPGGDRDRDIDLFHNGRMELQRNTHWYAYNTNKRGITLDIHSDKGKAIFKKLLNKFDIVLESYRPGYMARLGLGYQDLIRANTGVILTSITPFGQTGPYCEFNGSDLVCMALSGFLNLNGDVDRPPLMLSFPQAFLNASADAAAATLIAAYYRGVGGTGQHVDVSTQASMIANTRTLAAYWQLRKENLTREGNYLAGIFGTKLCASWKCKDGYIAFIILGGSFSDSTRLVMEWAATEGRITDTVLKDIDWNNFDMLKIDSNMLRAIESCCEAFFLSHTKEELFTGSIKRGIQMAPVNTVEDMLKEPQLAVRQFWNKVEQPELAYEMKYPGEFAKCSGKPLQSAHRAPGVGEHNMDVFHREMGFSQEEVAQLKNEGII